MEFTGSEESSPGTWLIWEKSLVFLFHMEIPPPSVANHISPSRSIISRITSLDKSELLVLNRYNSSPFFEYPITPLP